jgi:hypothetical protein
MYLHMDLECLDDYLHYYIAPSEVGKASIAVGRVDEAVIQERIIFEIICASNEGRSLKISPSKQK